MRAAVLAALTSFVCLGASLPAQISGIVVDSTTNQPVPGAIVTVQRTFVRATADASGVFSLPTVTGTVRVVAAARGYYNAGIQVAAPSLALLMPIDPVQIGNNPNYQFVSPLTCAGCHGDQWEQWNNSPMAVTAGNEWVHDLFSGNGSVTGLGGFVYQRDSVRASQEPNGSCAACHQPQVWAKNPGAALDPINMLSADAMHGVSCETCHKIADIDENLLNSHGVSSPSVTFNLPNDPVGVHQVNYGFLGDVTFRSSGLMRASYNPELVAETCASCHQYNNDHDFDGDFEDPGSTEGQATYEEWANSPYGNPNAAEFATCVDCHMPDYDSTEVCGLGFPPRPTSQPRLHRIEGTTPKFLENAVEMTMGVTDTGGSLSVQVDIRNSFTGHKVPSGVSPRNMVLIVDAWRLEDGVELVHTGMQVVDEFGGLGGFRQIGQYAGLPGKVFAKINNDANGSPAPIFTEGASLRYDTRIAPLATDTTTYTFAKPTQGTGRLRVRARLIYRRALRAIIESKGWFRDGKGNALEDIEAPFFGHLMEESEWESPMGRDPIEAFGTGCDGVSIEAIGGDPFAGNIEFGFAATGAAPNMPAFLLIGFSNTQSGGIALPVDLSPIGATGCFLSVATQISQMTATDASGRAVLPLALPPSTSAGTEFFVQWVTTGANNPFGLATTEGLSVITQR